MNSKTIAILGAGVQGLSTAILLLHQGATNVAIISDANVAEFDPSDPTFASPKAGANWQTFAAENDSRLQEYDSITYHALRKLAVVPECGIWRLPGMQFYDSKPQNFQHPWYKRLVEGYEECTQEDLTATKKFGIKYQTVTINVPKYHAWLTDKAKAMGATFVKAKLNHWEDALKYVKADIVINSTGLGSLWLGGIQDQTMYPVRGQIVVVRAPQVKRTISTSSALNGYRGTKNMAEAAAKVTYVIPREDGLVILGGTYQQNNFSMEVDPATTKSIIERCVGICPELLVDGKLPEIVEVKVGLRPGRKGDCRIDAQTLTTSRGRDVVLVNNYGHGGSGYQCSWGCALSVVKLVRQSAGVGVDGAALSKFLTETIDFSSLQAKLNEWVRNKIKLRKKFETMDNQTIVVLGAGVQGLTAALLLLHQKVKRVVIVAESSISEYNKNDPYFASPKAGANWQTYVGNHDYRLQSFDEASYYTLWSLSFLPQCGIMRVPGFQFYDEQPKVFEHPWYARFVKGYGFATEKDLPPSKKFGVRYETVTINVPKYVAWLMERVKAMGGTFVWTKLEHWEDALKHVKANTIINCTALGSSKLRGIEDKDLYPVRGQIVIVRAPQVQRTIGTALELGGSRGDMAQSEETSKVTYVIPREDGLVILGGTYQKNNFNMNVDLQTAQEIMDRCVAVCPELVVNGKLPEVHDHVVGLRPARYGDCRVDSQYLKTSTGREILFVNNYGHGGYGYQSSWGCARSVVTIVRRAIGVAQDEKLKMASANPETGSEPISDILNLTDLQLDPPDNWLSSQPQNSDNLPDFQILTWLKTDEDINAMIDTANGLLHRRVKSEENSTNINSTLIEVSCQTRQKVQEISKNEIVLANPMLKKSKTTACFQQQLAESSIPKPSFMGMGKPTSKYTLATTVSTSQIPKMSGRLISGIPTSRTCSKTIHK
ncbi:hypothetical protein HK100_002254 [Physocladia obscura]|uniref:FAD dependent oxidoreductase domain-containing protein n=1 Tax=Physocladia obscura TaxID=109957 RepID=A0AAD5XLF8_9FUNG|nr:hypothetical protein HK100_002254 [Physocladia obscura]